MLLFLLMVMSNKVIKLLNVWSKGLFSQLSISEIMKLSGKKTKTWVFNSLKLLKNNDLIVSERKGNMDLYSINVNNNLVFQLLNYLEVQKSIKFLELKLINHVINEVPVKNYCLIVFGSYADNKQVKGSDLDLCFLVENEQAAKKIKPYSNEIKLNYKVKVDEHYITFTDFKEMLLRNEENLGKQIVKKHKIFYNPCIYYQLLKEAHKRGFG